MEYTCFDCGKEGESCIVYHEGDRCLCKVCFEKKYENSHLNLDRKMKISCCSMCDSVFAEQALQHEIHGSRYCTLCADKYYEQVKQIRLKRESLYKEIAKLAKENSSQPMYSCTKCYCHIPPENLVENTEFFCTSCWEKSPKNPSVAMKYKDVEVDRNFIKNCSHTMKADFDPVTKPKHYNIHPSGVECIQITEWFNFCRGNAIKYLWRAGEKDPQKELEDLKKARWYLDKEIERLEKYYTDPLRYANKESTKSES